jgi:hypothetical protein
MIQLRDYQLSLSSQAYDILAVHRLVYLMLEMRVGKTLTALNVAKLAGATGVLMITPKKAVTSVQKDYDAFQPGYPLHLYNYGQEHNIAALELHYNVVIIDEAHRLGQFPKPSGRTVAIKELCHGRLVILLSGTASPESYSQLFHQYWATGAGPWQEYENFYQWVKAGYVIVRDRNRNGHMVKDYSEAIESKIMPEVKPTIVTYTQEEAGFTSFVEEQIVRLKMNKATYYLAGQLFKKRIFRGREGQIVLADTNVKLQQKLHQVFSGTVICELQEGQKEPDSEVFDRTKAEYIRDNYKGRKVAVFYKYRAELLALISVFGFDRITEDPDLFAGRDDLIFTSQIQTGREGVNLSTAEYLIMYNIDFAAVSYLQTKARLQTKDKTAPCVMVWLFAEDGIEQKIYDTVKDKLDYTIKYFQRDFREQIAGKNDKEVQGGGLSRNEGDRV